MPFTSTTITSDNKTITSTYDATSNSYQLTIPENSVAGTVIGKVAFDGGGPGDTLFTLLGPDAAKVRLAPDGILWRWRPDGPGVLAGQTPAVTMRA